MIGIIINFITFLICLIWFIKAQSYESVVSLLCSLSMLFGQVTYKIIKKMQKNKNIQKINSGNNCSNTQINTINLVIKD